VAAPQVRVVECLLVPVVGCRPAQEADSRQVLAAVCQQEREEVSQQGQEAACRRGPVVGYLPGLAAAYRQELEVVFQLDLVAADQPADHRTT